MNTTLDPRTLAEHLQTALDALHTIGGAYQLRKILARPHLTAPLRESLEKKALTDEQIERLALDTWERIAMAIAQHGETTKEDDHAHG